MPMDLESKSGGRSHIILGPIEKWAVIGGGSLLTLALGFIFVRIIAQQDAQQATNKQLTDLITEVRTEQAVMSNQLTTLNLQLSDVPDLRRKVDKLEVRVDGHDQDIKELRQTRGLR